MSQDQSRFYRVRIKIFEVQCAIGGSAVALGVKQEGVELNRSQFVIGSEVWRSRSNAKRAESCRCIQETYHAVSTVDGRKWMSPSAFLANRKQARISSGFSP